MTNFAPMDSLAFRKLQEQLRWTAQIRALSFHTRRSNPENALEMAAYILAQSDGHKLEELHSLEVAPEIRGLPFILAARRNARLPVEIYTQKPTLWN